jgi:hypothetical protein
MGVLLFFISMLPIQFLKNELCTARSDKKQIFPIVTVWSLFEGPSTAYMILKSLYAMGLLFLFISMLPMQF